jgi:hypothetical protein
MPAIQKLVRYRLQQLIYQKYGIDRYALGCEIVARWVQFETRDKQFTMEWIAAVCNAKDISEVDLYEPEAEALRQLFGLQSTEELYTN